MIGIIVIDTLLEKPVVNLLTITVLSLFRIGLIMNSNGDAEEVSEMEHVADSMEKSANQK